MGLDEGALQAALDAVVPPNLAGLVAGPGLGEPAVLADLLDVAMLGAGDRRAVVSVWALEAFEAVLPRVVAASVLLGRVPGGELNWVTGDHGVTGLRAAIWVDGSFEAFTLEVLRPLVALIAARGGVSPRVLWANAGHIVEAFVGMLEREAGVSAGSAAVRCLLAQPVVSGMPNGLFAPVRYVGQRRIRRVCCLRFLVPSWRICLICPLPEGHPERQR